MTRPLIRDGAHLFALCGLAVAQPLFDLLGRNPEFFAVRGSGRWEILAFAFLLVLVPPAALFAVEAAAELLRPRLRRVLHHVFVGLLGTLLAFEALRRAGGPAALTLAVGVLLGAAAAAAYARWAAARSFVSVLAPVPLLFLALFALTSSASKLILPQDARAAGAAVPSRTTPVVLVVLDEFSANAILDGRRRVDAVRFPGFAALARASDWYRNATTVHEGTTYAVPAILTGRYPRPGRLPLPRDYPHSLFTMLGGSYRLNVFENQTHLCPSRLCRGSSAGSFGGQLRSLVEDAGVVYLHRVLPKRLGKRLPSVSESWGDFLGHSDDEPRRFERLLSSLRPTGRPSLWMVHLLLPHSPWHYLPGGLEYETHYPAPPWGATEFWTKDAAIVVQNEQRYLLQIAYLDTLIVRLMRRLRETGLWDRALVIVTPDHGIGFTPGHKRRPVWPGNLHEIAFVPFFVKRPHQRAGRVIDEHVETVDVVPTIARVTGASAVGAEGRPLGSGGPTRPVVVRKGSGEKVESAFRPLLARRWSALRDQLRLFGSGTPWRSLFGVGPFRSLLGRRVADVPAAAAARVDVAGGEDFARVRLDDLEPVVQLHGTATGATSIAVGVNGRVAAVVPVFAGEFWALVPRDAFREGPNRVRAIGLR